MIRFLEKYSLKSYNTFGIDVKAKYFFEFTDIADPEFFFRSNKTWNDEKILILGGGSNILFISDFNGLVVYPNVPGIQVIQENRQNVWIEAGAGEEWDEFVRYCVFSEFSGIENLSLIPGKVGAAPIQNIGAYGCEVGNFIETVKGYNLENMKPFEMAGNECNFSYRDSIFKNKLKGKVIVTSVVFRLEKFPEFDLSYGNLEEEVKKLGEINIKNIRQAVINIRSSKLPDVKELGSAGSFFKNPVVGISQTEKIKKLYPEIPYYPAGNDMVKLAAGWLIDQCGWKGYREGDAGVHEKQALVLVNFGNATGKEIFDLSEKIRNSVFEKFGIGLEREVNVI
ncbi:MAG: UDP-N-acetylmuramate dehydrogenase [Prolixibacteraceae bacterium]|nr:UDP-N-acetylmuramate dehydrogenase [Prolixibacteraceae bacterium]MBN2775495.1 UDP-N-acetylmuramate dehydrogenase [Prolixibacteraceae bacterium]